MIRSVSYPPTTVAQYAARTFDLGIEHFEAAPGESVPVYSPARAVVDALRHRNRVGETFALSALGRYLRRRRDSDVAELDCMARALDAASLARPAVEAILA